METIDARRLETARFTEALFEIWGTSNGNKEVGLRTMIFLSFAHIVRIARILPWYSELESLFTDGDGSFDRLQQSISRLKERLQVSRPHTWDTSLDVPQSVLVKLRGAIEEHKSLVRLRQRLDHLVDLLYLERSGTELNQKIEKFIAHFARRWVPSGSDMMEYLSMTTGELGVRAIAGDRHRRYFAVPPIDDVFFEWRLKLLAHDISFEMAATHPDAPRLAAYSFLHPVRGTAQSYKVLRGADPWMQLSLETAEQFVARGEPGRRAAVVVSTADLKAGGNRKAARKYLLSRGAVLGVLELPRSVAGSARLSMLFIEVPTTTPLHREALLLDGRAVDGLRDEPHDRLAAFLSIPFSALDHDRDDGIWDGWQQDLGETLQARASTMFLSGRASVDGFFVKISNEELFAHDRSSLVPADSIPARELGTISSPLDGSPIRRLLDQPGPGRCFYVIGNNGAGKSLLLRNLVEVCAKMDRPVRTIASGSSDRFPMRMKGADYRYLGGRTSDRAIDPRKLGLKLADLLFLIYANPNRLRIFNAVAETLAFTARHFLLPESSSSALISVREIGSDPRPEKLDNWKLGLIKQNTDSIVPFDHLSTGEQQVLLLVAKLVAVAGPSVIFFIDEPETSLHVAWQRALPAVFKKISSDFDCEMVVATHSPVFISAATSADDFRFSAQGGLLSHLSIDTSNNVEGILLNDFQTYTENNREVHERCAELISQAISNVNSGKIQEAQHIRGQLSIMEATVARATPSLGFDGTKRHLDLIRRAKDALEQLTAEAIAQQDQNNADD